MKRTPLKPGAKSLARGSTFAPRKAPRRAPFTAASQAQRSKVAAKRCIACADMPCDPAHLAPRSHGGCDHPDCVIALCRACHRAFDDGRLDLTPHLSNQGFSVELAHMQGHYADPISVLQRLSGMRWAPERSAA